MSSTLPIVMSESGRVPQTPATLNSQLIAGAVALSPGLTANLPGSLIEDISSTDTAALVVCDSAVTELINSLTPYGANLFILNQLGQIYLGAVNGAQGSATNNSVNVVFTGPAGFVIAVGFTISDGTNQYTVQDGGIIGTGGVSPPLFCLANLPGSWAIPVGSVTQIITSLPPGISLSVTNPLAGTIGLGLEKEEAYRARVLMSGIASAQGMGTFLKTLLTIVPGVQPRLVSVRQIVGSGWEIICGGGDPYQVITWHYFKGDGKVFNVRWLKRRIARFLNGVNGTDYTIDQTYQIGVSFGIGNQVNIRILSGIAKFLGGAVGSNAFGTMPFGISKLKITQLTPIQFAPILQSAIE